MQLSAVRRFARFGPPGAATLLYFAALVPSCPHPEFWPLHAGCVMLLLAWWHRTPGAPRRLSLRTALFALVTCCLTSVGVARIVSNEALTDEFGTQLVRLRDERTLRPVNSDSLASLTRRPSVAELVSIARERSAGWGLSAVQALDRVGDESAADYRDAADRPFMCGLSMPRWWRFDPARVSWLRAALEEEHRRQAVAEKARARLLEIVDRPGASDESRSRRLPH